ncbi:hypothetical protein M3Y97_00516000 [Aphelenchoides bicaudatus]|nr:hypothetical protein M3Y97_00516000 [Aphelenchoides bicaudatus]
MKSDEHLKDKIDSSDGSKSTCRENIPSNLLLPFPCATIGPGESVVSFSDCKEDTLESLEVHFNVEHLSECKNANFFKYPMAGLVHGICNRFVVPLKVRSHAKSTDLVVYFVVDSGAPLTSFGEKTIEKLFGNKESDTVIIQDISVFCRRSGDFNEALKNVNLLGSQFLLRSKTSIILSPYQLSYPYDDEKVFYLAPFSMISQAQTMANSRQQTLFFRCKNSMKRALQFHSLSHPISKCLFIMDQQWT